MKNRLLARWVLLAAGVGGLAGCVSGEGVTKNPPAVHEVSPPRTGADWVNAGSEDISGVLAPVILRAHIPGAVAVVLRGDRIVAHGVAGVRKAGAIEPVTLDDQFELCSGTKAMTATLVGRLVEQGRLSWETTFADVFGDALPEMDPAWREVTVEQALAHRAGTRDELFTFARAVLWSDATVAEQRRAYAAKILSRPPRLEPKKHFSITARIIYWSARYWKRSPGARGRIWCASSFFNRWGWRAQGSGHREPLAGSISRGAMGGGGSGMSRCRGRGRSRGTREIAPQTIPRRERRRA